MDEEQQWKSMSDEEKLIAYELVCRDLDNANEELKLRHETADKIDILLSRIHNSHDGLHTINPQLCTHLSCIGACTAINR
jgi:hypothetical protein